MADLTLFGATGTFEVQGNTADGTLIFFDATGYAHLPAASWKAMAKEFAGRTVSLEALRDHLQKTAGFRRDLSRQVAAILIAEGLATGAGDGAVIFPPS